MRCITFACKNGSRADCHNTNTSRASGGSKPQVRLLDRRVIAFSKPDRNAASSLCATKSDGRSTLTVPRLTVVGHRFEANLYIHTSPWTKDENHNATSVQSHRPYCCCRLGKRTGFRRIKYFRLFNSPVTLWRKLCGRLSCGSRADSLYVGRETERLDTRGQKGIQSRGAEDQHLRNKRLKEVVSSRGMQKDEVSRFHALRVIL